jgi:hypothetical protein
MLKKEGNDYVKKSDYENAVNSYVNSLRLCHPMYL